MMAKSENTPGRWLRSLPEERSRSRNAAAAELAASRAALEAERARIQAMRKPGAAETGVEGLFSLSWMTQGG